MASKKIYRKQYSTAECDFVVEWADRWFQLNQLLYDLFKFNETPSPPPPKVVELNYQSLRKDSIKKAERGCSLNKMPNNAPMRYITFSRASISLPSLSKQKI